MNLLAISTSGAVASAALLRDGTCVHSLQADADKRHAETVLPLIERLLAEADTRLTDVALFCADVGPGSFTGVRIGVSVVNAMAAVLGKKVVPVDALRAVYESLGGGPERVCVLLDAGNGNGYAAQFCAGKELTPPEAVVTEPYLAALPEGTVILAEDRTGERQPLIPEARFVAAAAYRMMESAEEAVMPLYLRPSQAERMWKLRREAEQDGH